MDRTHHFTNKFSRTLNEIGWEFEFLAADAVGTFVGGSEYVSIRFHGIPELLHALNMPGFSSANEVVIFGIDCFKHWAPRLADKSINPILGTDTTSFGGSVNFCSVFVNPGQKPHILTTLSVPAGEDVACGRRISVTDMR
jgi:hypothetical protein